MIRHYLAVALIGAAVLGSVGCTCCRKATAPPPPCCPPGGVPAAVPAPPPPAISGYRAAIAAPCPTCVTR